MTYPVGMTNWLGLINDLIDDRIDLFGLRNTITYLLDKDVDPDILVSRLAFDRDDVVSVIKEDFDVNDYMDFLEGDDD